MSEPGSCPACKDKALEELVDREVPFLGCVSCFGLFVVEPSLGQYVCNTTGSEPIAQAYDALLASALATGVGGPTKRTCPTCTSPMRRLGFGEAPFVILDRCVDGHGLWLDKKELKKIVRASRAHAAVLGLTPPLGDDDLHDDDDD